MEIRDLDIQGYERVARAHDPESGLLAFISVHDTTMGPALGGLRMWNYASEEEGLTDVLRLSKGMTYKSAVAHTGLGGGKAVIVGDPRQIKSEALYLAMGRFIDSFGGLYTTAEDVNTTIEDLTIVKRTTNYVTGLSREQGGSGNPSPYTAYGVYLGVRAALGHVFGDDSPKGRKVAVQGVGAVGSALARRLAEAGAQLFVTDTNQERVQALVDDHGATAVGADDIYGLDVDVFAPCALGAVINDKTIPMLRTPIVAGAANNVLHELRHGRELRERNILYAPDYVINAGGIINVGVEVRPEGYDEGVALQAIERIPQALKELWQIAKDEGLSSAEAADRLAEKILAEERQRRTNQPS